MSDDLRQETADFAEEKEKGFASEVEADKSGASATFGDEISQETDPDSVISTDSKAKHRKKWLSLIGGVVLVAILAMVIIPIVDHNKKQAQYDQGMALLENGDFEEAKEVFLSLGDFEDSAEQAAFAQKAIYYETAMDFYESGNYEEAEKAFINAEDYLDAQKLAVESGAKADYAEAKLLMEAGEYDRAKELLVPLDSAIITDRDALIEECENKPRYLEAKAQLANGENYLAYLTFTMLGDYMDSEELAQECTVPVPDTGETYRNESYWGSECALVVKPSVSDGNSTYVKVYDSDETLISSIFINAGDEATVDLPSGIYRIKVAYGSGPWFGEKEMFGDDGFYQVLKDSPTEEMHLFEADYIYTFTLRSDEPITDGTDIPTIYEYRGDF